MPIVGQCVLSKLLYVCLLLTATDSSTLSRLPKNQAVCNSVIVKNTLPHQVESPRFILHGNLSTLSSTLSYLAPSTTRLYAQIQVQLNCPSSMYSFNLLFSVLTHIVALLANNINCLSFCYVFQNFLRKRFPSQANRSLPY